MLSRTPGEHWFQSFEVLIGFLNAERGALQGEGVVPEAGDVSEEQGARQAEGAICLLLPLAQVDPAVDNERTYRSVDG